ncbi:MAG: D-glycero-beta-D-manno-heptose 1-phosphate adenylyltransferase [Candidatus Eremiobacteraeota bacterium]|nr:D-glycero-beta-D-manno-heptose 1-phosphate adenylyltransferase [Candidatus Eremiobacteraeota bacterium]
MDIPEQFFGSLLTTQRALEWRHGLRERAARVVFTNGCFDILHAGHVEYLAWARAQGDALVVGLNSDDSVRRLKGEFRPVTGFADRARVLSALRTVDAVVGFDEPTPEVLLEKLQPDIHVKSSQYREEDLPERDVVLAAGGRIVLAPHVRGKSTTDIIARIAAKL